MARVTYNWNELYNGKAGTILDHQILSVCLDNASTWTGGWLAGDAYDADYDFADNLETVVLVNAFNAYWSQLNPRPTYNLYIKCLDADHTVPLIGYQFNIDDENPFPNPTSPRGFNGITLEA